MPINKDELLKLDLPFHIIKDCRTGTRKGLPRKTQSLKVKSILIKQGELIITTKYEDFKIDITDVCRFYTVVSPTYSNGIHLNSGS